MSAKKTKAFFDTPTTINEFLTVEPKLNEAYSALLDSCLDMYQNDADSLCHAISEVYDHKKREFIANEHSGKDVVKVFDIDLLNKRYQKIIAGDRNVKVILNKFNLEEDSGYRELMPVTQSFFDGLTVLKKNYPNCHEFLDYVEQFAALSQCRSHTKKMYFPPVILAGPPGVGKTAIVREVAKLLSVPCKQLDMAAMTSGFVIAGSSSAWSDAKTGCIVDILRDNKVANPIIILDELDKVSTDAKFDPVGGLYTLLEQEAAARFTDEALEQPIDASHILYVATANNLAAIPEPLLSRFLVINIKDVKGEHHRQVTQSIYQALIKYEKMEQAFIPSLHDSIFEALESYSPREVKRLLIRAMAYAAYRKQRTIGLDINADDLRLPTIDEVRMGFLS